LDRPDDNQHAIILVGQQVAKSFNGKMSKYEILFDKERVSSLSSKPNPNSAFKIIPMVIGILGNTQNETLKFLDTIADFSDDIYRMERAIS
jgi:tetrahydromethanopterin S-methyltransferase subunit H